jgi:hypothetical protein
MAGSWGPIHQARGTDVRWHVEGAGANSSLMLPSAHDPDVVVRSHDPGMYQPTLFRPNPHPDLFTSVVVEASAFDNPELGLFAL